MWPRLTGSGNCKTAPLRPETVIDCSPAAVRLPSQVTVSVFALEEPPQPVSRAGKIRRDPSSRRFGIASHILLKADAGSFIVPVDEHHHGGIFTMTHFDRSRHPTHQPAAVLAMSAPPGCSELPDRLTRITSDVPWIRPQAPWGGGILLSWPDLSSVRYAGNGFPAVSGAAAIAGSPTR